MKPVVLILGIAFAAGAGLVRVTIPSTAGENGTPTSAKKKIVEAEGVAREANYKAVEASDVPFEAVQVELIAEESRWHVRVRKATGMVAVPTALAPDGTTAVRLPAYSRVRLTLTSRDYVYLLALPRIGKSQVAVPGREFRLEFGTVEPGTFVLRGSHVCGPPRRALDVTVRVESKADFEAWLGTIADPQRPEAKL